MNTLRRSVTRAADLVEIGFRFLGWLAVTTLCAAGILFLLFLLMSGFSAESFFAHLANIASRYLDAEEARRAAFLQTSALFFLGCMAVATLLTLQPLLRIIESKRERLVND